LKKFQGFLRIFADSSARGDLKVAVPQQGLGDESSRCRPKKITLFSSGTLGHPGGR
jgi:hypothetical protein